MYIHAASGSTIAGRRQKDLLFPAEALRAGKRVTVAAVEKKRLRGRLHRRRRTRFPPCQPMAAKQNIKKQGAGQALQLSGALLLPPANIPRPGNPLRPHPHSNVRRRSPAAKYFFANPGKFSQTGCRPARKFNAEGRKKSRRLGVLAFFKQGLRGKIRMKCGYCGYDKVNL